MYKVIPVGAAVGGECYLLITEEKTALIDSGFAYSAPEMVKNLKSALEGRPLDYVLITHSHYDHASGAPFCKDEWPELRVIAGEHAARVFARPGARETMRAMNEAAEKLAGSPAYAPCKSELAADIAVKEGDIIDLGDMKLRVLEMPGHTKCSIAFFSEEQRLLIACETLGVQFSRGGEVMPCYLVGYETSVNAIERAAALAPEAILIPHFGLVGKQEADYYLRRALVRATEVKDAILNAYLAGKSMDDMTEVVRRKIYEGECAKYQPEEAFLLNASYMIPMVLRECLGKEVTG